MDKKPLYGKTIYFSFLYTLDSYIYTLISRYMRYMNMKNIGVWLQIIFCLANIRCEQPPIQFAIKICLPYLYWFVEMCELAAMNCVWNWNNENKKKKIFGHDCPRFLFWFVLIFQRTIYWWGNSFSVAYICLLSDITDPLFYLSIFCHFLIPLSDLTQNQFDMPILLPSIYYCEKNKIALSYNANKCHENRFGVNQN